MQHQVAVFSFGWQETLKLQTVNLPPQILPTLFMFCSSSVLLFMIVVTVYTVLRVY